MLKPAQSLMALSLVLLMTGFMGGCARTSKNIGANQPANQPYTQQSAVRGAPATQNTVSARAVTFNSVPTPVSQTMTNEFKGALVPNNLVEISLNGSPILYAGETMKNGKPEQIFVTPAGKLVNRETVNWAKNAAVRGANTTSGTTTPSGAGNMPQAGSPKTR